MQINILEHLFISLIFFFIFVIDYHICIQTNALWWRAMNGLM